MRELLPADPRMVGPYRLLSRLGEGGMGEVFLGRSPGGRAVAVKLVRPELAGDVQFRLRFAVEVEAARRVGGFYTAQVVDADTEALPPWLVTSYVPGLSLREAVAKSGPLPAEAIAALGAGLSEGLKAIHACGVVHRDLKPGNVILADDGPRVIDFGIARALDATSHLTRTGAIGTPSFMSPEQIRGEEATPASDVFSLAAVLAYASTGRGPFGDGPAEAVVYRVVHEEPALSGVAPEFADLIAAGLAKDPDDRPGVDEILRQCADSTGSAGSRLPFEINEMINKQVAKTRTLTTENAHDVSSDTESPPSDSRTVNLQSVPAVKKPEKSGYTPVALPWIPGKTSGARKAEIIRWHKQVGELVDVDDPLLEVTSARGSTVITSPVSGTLLAAYRGEGKSAHRDSVLAAIGKTTARAARPPLPRPVKLALNWFVSLVGTSLVGILVFLLIATEGSLYNGDMDDAKVGDCAAQEFDSEGKANWFTKPCTFMKLRKLLNDQGDEDLRAYMRVTYRDPERECREYDEDWNGTQFENVFLCHERL